MPNDEKEIKTITTSEYRITPGLYAREAISNWTGRFWFLVALPLVALACYGVWFDWRYLVVTACIIFILFPSFAMAGFYMALTSRGARYALYPQTLTMPPDGSLSVVFSPIPARSDQKASPSGKAQDDGRHDTTDTDGAGGSAAPEAAPAPIVLGRNQIESCKRWHRHTVVCGPDGLKLIIPDSAFRDLEENLRFEERLGGRFHTGIKP